MAYKRRVTQDGVTVMNKELYDNLQDGIDESKQAVQDLEENVGEQFKKVDNKLQDSGGIKFDGERDMIMVKNPFTGEWIDWQATGKIILPSTITVTTNTLGGKTVTCVIGGKTYTTEFSVASGTQGVAVFTVYEDGKAVITCESYTTSVTVQEKGNQNVSVSLEEFIGYTIIRNGERNTEIQVEKDYAIGTTSAGRFKIYSDVNTETMYYRFVLEFPKGYLSDKIISIQGKFNTCIVWGYYKAEDNNLRASTVGLFYDGSTSVSATSEPQPSYESQEIKKFLLSNVETLKNNLYRMERLTLTFYVGAMDKTDVYLDLLSVGTV